ncbi:HET domain containing protein [Hyaloscypha variabilis]
MDITKDLDSDNVSPAPACICQPLHRNCNPSTCRRAPNVDTARNKDDLGKLTESPSSKKSFIQVTCNRGDLRHAALRGCTTCAILYGGAGPKDAPVVGNNPWPSVMEDENVMVQIRVVGGLVRCKLWPACQTTRGYKLPINLAFYAPDRSYYRSSCQVFSPLSSLSDSTNSSTSFEQVATWLDECRSHSNCGVPSQTVLPTRVIDVGHLNDPQPFLFESGDLVAPYIALSHCWGKTPIVRTTKAALARRKQGIDISLLPPAFQDAIVITRRLDVRYLWIDSLCIIQDDPLDWQTESARMSTIYQQALLTISAGHRKSVEITPTWISESEEGKLLGSTESQNTISEHTSSTDESATTVHADSLEPFFAEDNTEESGHMKSCFVVRLPNHIGFCTMSTKRFRQLWAVGGGSAPFPLPRTTSGIFVRNHGALMHEEFASDFLLPLPPNHISSRAWVFQERLLSTRVVNYTSEEIVWECKTAVDCQCKRVKIYDKKPSWGPHTYSTSDSKSDSNPENAPGLPEKFAASSQTLKIFFENQILDKNMSSEGLVLVWTNVVFHYSSLHLSNPNDRLPALSGLARVFRFKELLGEYVAGLWTEHLDRMLCWSYPSHCVPGNRPAGYIAPTWSWASIQGGVYFSNLWDDKAGILGAYSTIVGSVQDVGVVRAGQTQPELCLMAISPCQVSWPPRTPREKPSELDLDSKSESSDSDSDSDASTNYYRESEHPYGYRIVREGIDLRQPFVPDSISELDVLMKEHTVTLLLWAVRDGPWTKADTRAFSCFVLLPHQDGRYTRLGFLQYHEINQEDQEPTKTWFGDTPTRSVLANR